MMFDTKLAFEYTQQGLEALPYKVSYQSMTDNFETPRGTYLSTFYDRYDGDEENS